MRWSYPLSCSRGAPSRLLALFGLLLLGSSCRETLLPYGEVALLLSTDMGVPDGFDTLVLERKSGQRWVFAAGDIPSSQTPGDCGEISNPDSTRLALPTSLVLKSSTEDRFSAELTLMACKAGKRVFARTFQVEFPEPGQQKMVRAPIRWLCSDWERSCYGCFDREKLGPQSCHHQSVFQLASSKHCSTIACTAPEQADVFFLSVDYKATEVGAYSAGTESTESCFDVSKAFAAAPTTAGSSQFGVNRSWFHVPTQWREDPTKPGEYSCEGVLSISPASIGGPLNVDYLNLALVLPQSATGSCTTERCLVALEAQNSVGWKWKPGEDWDASGERSILLPQAVCHMLDSGQILYVLGTGQGKQKGYKVPFCALSGTSPTQVKESVSGDAHSLAFSLDDQDVWSAPGQGMPRLESKSSSISGLSVPMAVSGRAGRFTSDAYAFYRGSLLQSRSFTLSGWVSLTELETGSSAESTQVMPLISDVSSDCLSGGRLELHATEDQSSVQVALGLPTGMTESGQCSFEYSCALLGSTSYAGGYFTPWSTGIWYHVAATVPYPGEPVLYVDGVQSNPTPCYQSSAALGSRPHDASVFYLGSSKASVGTPTHPVLIDEVLVSRSAVNSSEVKQLSLYPRTVPGASGFRWGTWGGQGSFASLSAPFPLPVFTVNDAEFGSAGGFALLAEPAVLAEAAPTAPTQDLSAYDEMVLVADLPDNQPFQLSLVAAHGKSQCVWQLFSKPKTASSSPTYSDSYVVDLRRPSWCVSPGCGFDLSAVESLTIGSDWKDRTEKHSYSVRSLAFRQRTSQAQAQRPKSIGGKTLPNGWCWRSVTYDPRWDVGEVQTDQGVVTFPEPIATPFLSDYDQEIGVPELAADPAPGDQIGPRDLSTCTWLRLDLGWSKGQPSGSASDGNVQFAMKDRRGYTCWFDLDTSSNIARVNLQNQPLGVWGPNMPANADVAKEYGAIRSSVTRISVRSEHAVTVRSVQCCDAGDLCRDLQ